MIAKIKCLIFGHFYQLHYWRHFDGGLKIMDKCKNCGKLIFKTIKCYEKQKI